MKTIHEEAKKYVGYKSGHYTTEQLQSINDFKAGVKFAQRWIPVEDELPEKMEDHKRFSIDVFVKENNTDFCPVVAYYYFNEKRWCFYHDVYFNVTHWRPIELK